ncbi:MAG: MBL fold metallo-hydrolase [bacterium]|nr:MBL fold metallo-hydrolase [bacterium]
MRKEFVIIILCLAACMPVILDAAATNPNTQNKNNPAGSLQAVRAAKHEIQIGVDLFADKIMDDAYVVVHYFPWGGNCLVVRLSQEDVLLVDTPYENEATKLLVEWIKKTFGDVSITAINTGFHVDNLGGNGYLLSNKIPVYGADLTAKLVTDKGDSQRDFLLKASASAKRKRFHDRYQKLQFKAPDRPYKLHEGLVLKKGGEKVEVFFPGETHTVDNVAVYFHKRKILFGGCMLQSTERNKLGFIGDANMKQWPTAVEKVIKKFNDCKIIIPGHGKWGGKDIFQHTLTLIKKHPKFLETSK